jgi:hypothetical protein
MQVIILTAVLLPLTAFAQTAVPVPKAGNCPSGYTESGGYCSPMRAYAPAAIPNRGKCPAGCMQSG